MSDQNVAQGLAANSEHRKEIDGLRAIAVLSVVFCHAGFAVFAGGFVGVDVFFVISGYLITSIILRELDAGTFSLRRFYERRARRILPALFLMLAVCLPLAWWWLWPADFRDFAKSLVYVVLFASNIHFFKEIGYFSPDVELRPLLHTWSLGVEEQYYILFPLILMFVWRLRRHWLAGGLVVLLMLSLLGAQLGLARLPEASFYLLPARAWELLLGAVYALLVAQRHPVAQVPQPWRNPLSLAGLGMILCAVFLYSPATPFPGLSALMPTLGALLVIAAATPETLAGKLLAWRPVQWVGLCSYSIYLWHQPVFAFARYRLDEPAMPLMAALIALTLMLGYLSWRYVEGPFRRPCWQGRRLAAFALVGMAGFIVLGMAGRHRADIFKRFAPAYEVQIGVERQLSRNYGLDKACDELRGNPQCQTADNPEVLLWGDSYAMHLADGIIASQPDVGLVQRTESGCAPLLGIAPVRGGNLSAAEACLRFNEDVLAELKRMPSIRYVVLASPFAQYLKSENSLLVEDGRLLSVDSGLVLKALQETLRRLEEMQVSTVVVSPPPANGGDLGKCLARSVLLERSLAHCDFAQSEMSLERLAVYRLLAALPSGTRVVWLHELMCQGGHCASHDGNTFLYLDDGHLSRDGSVLLGKKYDFYRLFTGGKALTDREKP